MIRINLDKNKIQAAKHLLREVPIHVFSFLPFDYRTKYAITSSAHIAGNRRFYEVIDRTFKKHTKQITNWIKNPYVKNC